MSAESYFSAIELAAIQVLPCDQPYAISPVRGTIFSIARFSGGMKLGRWGYRYDEARDICIRRDVDTMVQAMRKLEAKRLRTERKEAAKAAQGALL